MKNVILQWDITKENRIKCILQLHRNGPVDYKIWGVVSQCAYETKNCDIRDVQKRLMQTWFDFYQND